jgi:hypothetical protein
MRKHVSEKGQQFSEVHGERKSGLNYQSAIAEALSIELGNSHRAVKTVMRWTGANERTVKNWFAGRRGPRGEHLLSLIRHSSAVLEAVLRLTGREQLIAGKMLLDVRSTLLEMLASIDATIPERERSG